MIQVIPAIDIIDGKCVRLSQGDFSKKTQYADSPADMAMKYADAGIERIHVVDLDGAKKGEPCNLGSLEEIVSKSGLDVEWGGGVKSEQHLKEVFDAGAGHAIIGSLAVSKPELMEHWLAEYGGDRIILGADLRNGKVSVAGWLKDSALTADDLLKRFIPYGLSECIVTEISRDGMLQGPATDLYLSLQNGYPAVTFTVSGGISDMNDIRYLDRLGLKRVIVGKAIYEGRISLKEITDFIFSNDQ